MSALRLFGAWLSAASNLQHERYGNFPETLEGKEYADYMRTNFTAAIVELGEMMQEADWKPYKNEGRNPEKREKFLEEMVDALHHLANLLCLERVSDQELSDAYLAKMEKNRTRTDHNKTDRKRDVYSGEHEQHTDGGELHKVVPCSHPRDFGGALHPYDVVPATPDDFEGPDPEIRANLIVSRYA